MSDALGYRERRVATRDVGFVAAAARLRAAAVFVLYGTGGMGGAAPAGAGACGRR